MPTKGLDPFDAVKRTSRAFQELLRQQRDAPTCPDRELIAALTGDDTGPPVFELEPIWRAALADDSCPETIGRRRYLSPRRFVNGWPNWVGARDDSDGRIRVDEDAAFTYCQRLDHRVMARRTNPSCVAMTPRSGTTRSVRRSLRRRAALSP